MACDLYPVDETNTSGSEPIGDPYRYLRETPPAQIKLALQLLASKLADATDLDSGNQIEAV